MTGSSVFDAVVRAVDQASGPLRTIAAHVRGLGGVVDTVSAHAKGMGHVLNSAFGEAEHGAHRAEGAAHGAAAAAKHAGHEIAHAAHPHAYGALAGHIGVLRGHFGALSISAGEFGHSISEFLPALAGLGAAGGLVGLFEITEQAAEKFSLLNKAAITAGVSAQQFANLSFAAKMTDVNVEAMGTGLFRLNRVIGDTAAGKNKDAAALFKHLGINVRDATGHLRSSAAVFPDLAEAFERTTDPAMRARMAMALFGRAGGEMLPLLIAGREELEKFSKQAEDVGFVPKGADAKALLEYDDALKVLTAASQGFIMAIGTKLAPVLKPIVEQVTEWVTANREWVATGIADAVGKLAAWVKTLDLKAIIVSTREWSETVLTLGHHVSGTMTAIVALTLALGSPLIAGIAGALSAFGSLIKIVRGLTLVLWANPIVLAIAALAVGAVLLYAYWDDVTKFLTSSWRAISETFDSAWSVVSRVVTNVLKAAGDMLGSAWTSIAAFFDRIWKAVSAAFSDAWNASVKFIVDALQAAGQFIMDAWAPVRDFFTGLWDGIKRAFDNAWGYIEPIIKRIEDAAAAISRLNPFGGESTPAGPRVPLKPLPPELMMPFIIGSAGSLPSPYDRDNGVPPVQLPSLYGPGSPTAAPASASEGRVRTEVVFRNTPPGTTVRSNASGNVDLAELDVGYSSPLGAVF